MLRFLQSNLGRRRVSHDLAHAACLRDSIDMLIVGEPNKSLVTNSPDWLVDLRKDMAVRIYNKNIQVEKVDRKAGFIHIKLKNNLNIVVAYISPNIEFGEYDRKIEEIMETAEASGGEYIISGDFNAKAVEWGSRTTNARGEALMGWIAAKNLTVLNQGGEPTCVTANGESCIDLTLATPGVTRRMGGWRVSLEVNLTEHRFIYYEVYYRGTQNARGRAWNGRLKLNIDRARFKREIRGRMQENNGGVTPEEVTRTIARVMEESTTRRANGSAKVPYWWNARIEGMRESCNAARRRRQRGRGITTQTEEQRNEDNQRYKEQKRILQKEIRSSKRQMWRGLCSALDDDVWGEGYRIVTRLLGGITERYNITEEQKEEIIRKMFPQRNDNWEREATVADPPMFTVEELKAVIDKIKNGKAPGTDRIPPEIIKDTVEMCGEHMLAMLNALLRSQSFPRAWKVANVILIPKGKGPQNEETQYRPICLLSVLAKVYEGLVRNRLNVELEDRNGLAINQYGFRSGRSTIDAIKKVTNVRREADTVWVVLLTLDVKNAFNEASWGTIMSKLADRDIPAYLRNIVGEYLNQRKIKLGSLEIDVTAGVPQGSVLGTTLWNVMYDDVLRLELPPGVQIVGYADDLGVTFAANEVKILNRLIRETIDKITEWMEAHHLKLAPHKTEAMVMKGPYKRDEIRIMVMGSRIQLKRAIKYLGVTIDTQGYYGQHVMDITQKANIRTTALVKLMPNIGGPSARKREVLWGVVQSTILYASPVWSSCLQISRYKNMLIGVQRKALLRVSSAYRTVSAEAVQVITGIPPVDLLVYERARIMEGQDKELARAETLGVWQRRWNDNRGTAQWTKQLIKELQPWVKCGHRDSNYFLTQFLTGHGTFRTYTRRIGKNADEDCIYCHERDTPEHTIFRCGRWEMVRVQYWAGLDLNPDNIVGFMLESRKKWREATLTVQKIIAQKEREEREYQGRHPQNP